MEKVSIEFVNCYGIGSLKYQFDFTSRNLVAIYAPNGSMKTSFANVFKDFSEGKLSSDRINKKRETKRLIVDEREAELNKGQVFVIEPYNPNYKSSKISTLLVNKVLKEKYDRIYEDIDDKKEALLKELKDSSGLKSNVVEGTLSNDIAHDPKEFFLSLTRIQQEVMDGKASSLSDVNYQKIFNDKVLAFLGTPDFQEKLSKYMSTYDALIGTSTFFKKGIFNHNNAADIAKSLKENGFFKAEHSVYLHSGKDKTEIKTESDLEKFIHQEKESILKNVVLEKSFDEIDKLLIKNKESKEFREYLEKNMTMLPELANLPRFKQKLWVSYLIKSIDAFKTLMSAFEKGKSDIQSIVESARKESTKWAGVINVFNERFSVPFEVIMANQEDVILKSEAPSIKFKFKDSDNNNDVEESELWTVLSNGERRALYLLNVIFEVQAREEMKEETLFIVDDIADSFDYKNKYAIIEYLNDMAKKDYFIQIVLTHNYDFLRTLGSRLSIPRSNRLHIEKSGNNITMVQEKYQHNPFTTWKAQLHQNNEMLIASIPFVRNLAQYCGLEAGYEKMTKLLHLKTDTSTITVKELEMVIKDVLKDMSGLSLANGNKVVKELIYETADSIYSETAEVIELEKKIVLSMAIRLKTEEILVKEINDNAFVNAIASNQTITLINKFKEKYPKKVEVIKMAEQVNLMTPENIHLNSFMYEPILDMSNIHLKQLYKKVSEYRSS